MIVDIQNRLPFFMLALLRPFSASVVQIPRYITSTTLWLGYANSVCIDYQRIFSLETVNKDSKKFSFANRSDVESNNLRNISSGLSSCVQIFIVPPMRDYGHQTQG